MLHTDGRTDMTKLIVALRSFLNMPNNGWRCTSIPCVYQWCGADFSTGTVCMLCYRSSGCGRNI